MISRQNFLRLSLAAALIGAGRAQAAEAPKTVRITYVTAPFKGWKAQPRKTAR